MSSLLIERDAAGARTLRMWSTATLATLVLAACGGGGGDDPAPPPQNPPPQAPTNVAPTANAGADQTVALPTDTFSLSGSATDDSLPTNSTLAYTWTYANGPLGPNSAPGAIIESSSSANTNVRIVGGPGDYTFNLTASDSALTSAADSVVVTVQENPNVFPTGAGLAGWATATFAEAQMSEAKLNEAKTYSETATDALNNPEAGVVVRGGKVVFSWGANVNTLFDLKSTTKSMGGLALLLALDEGKVALSDKARARLSSFGLDPAVDTSAVTTGTPLEDITILQLATHTAGFSKSDDPNNDPRALLSVPGTTWFYSDQGLNWLADVLTQTYAQDLNTLLTTRVYSTLGIGAGDAAWRTNAFRTPTLNVGGTDVPRRELASGIFANVNAMARIGLLMLNKGVWGNTQVMSNSIVARAHAPTPEIASATISDPVNFPDATVNYGVLWWTNANQRMENVPPDAFWAWGLHETLIIVVPSLDLVVARAGTNGWRTQGSEFWNADYDVIEPFLTPIVESITP
jgi:CubicO group peptidase (beta-lactamase class C family)